MDDSNEWICRICLNKCRKKSSLFEISNSIKYADMMKEYIGIVLEHESGLPCGLCKHCRSDLNCAIKFISQVRTSSEKLNARITWILPIIHSNSVIKDESISYSVPDNNIDDLDTSINDDAPSKHSDSESELSLQILRLKSKQNREEYDDHTSKFSVEKEESDIKKELRDDYLLSKYVIMKKEECGLGKDMVKCLTCGILSVNRSAFIVHYRKHSGEKPHKCQYCKMKYSQIGTLNAHIKKVHPIMWDKIKSKTRKLKRLKEEEALRNSQLSTESQHIGFNGEPSPDKPRLRVTCEICGKSYYHKYALNVHMRVHNVDKQIQCPFCPQRFVQSSDRLIHIRIHHTGEKPFICHICAKSFASGTNLRTHLLSHSNERKFKCDICFKGMKTKDNLKRHLLVMHSQTKAKVCHICGKAYALTYKLNNHMKIWHARSGDCDICKKTFKNIQSHMKTHSTDKKTKVDKQFKCHMCHKSFSKQKNLVDHVQKHQDEEASFKCSYENCHSAFAKKRVLDFHVLKYHLKQTPHVCQYCNKGFYRKGDLGQHLKTIHVPYTVNSS